jgi:CubicO group peptidase (beta-lactamase class C family)
MTEFSRLERWIEARMDLDGTPGLGIAITNRNETIYVGHYGFADLAARTPAGPEHVWQNGSIGKSYTALLLLILNERGQVDLHAPVKRYLPWFEASNPATPITIHHLLTHTSGLFGGSDVAADGRFEAWSLRDRPVLGAPGERFSYSDVGYKVLGYVIEEIVGESYSAAVTREILEPLGMRDSFTPITDRERHRFAVGYRFAHRDRTWRNEHGLVPDAWIETGTGDGSIAVTTADMARYTRAILNRGAGLIGEESFALMVGDLGPRDEDDPDSTYGYGLMTFDLDGHRCYGHGGDMLGYFASMVLDGEAGLGVCTLTNGPGNEDTIAEVALGYTRAKLTGGDAYELPPVVPHSVIEEAPELAGVYRNDKETWELIAEGSSLYLVRDERRVPIERYRGTRYLLVDPEFDRYKLTFERDEEERVVALCHGPRWLGRDGAAHDAPGESRDEWRAFVGVYQNYNPWQQRFEVFLRRGILHLELGYGWPQAMIELEPGLFQVGSPPSADRLRFDAIAQGQALRAELNGQNYYRTLWSSLPSARSG